MPSTPKTESIFATGRSADNFIGNGERTIDSNDSENLLELTNGILNFENDIVEDLGNSIDQNYAMLLDMDYSELGLDLDDPYWADNGVSFENQAEEPSPSPNDLQGESNFEFNQVEADIMNILEDIEQMPWFDTLLN